MSVTLRTVLVTSAAVILANCSGTTIPATSCKGIGQSQDLPSECCNAAGGLKEELFLASRCSISGQSDLIAKCGPQAIPGAGIMSGLAGGFGQGLSVIANNMDLARTYHSEKDGVSTENATEGPTPYVPSMGGAGGDNGGSGVALPASNPTARSNSVLATSGSMNGGPSGGTLGGAKTAAASLTNPNAQLGMVGGDASAEYSAGGAGSGKSRGGGGGGSGGGAFSGMIQSLMGGLSGGGKDGASGGDGVQRFGAQGSSSASNGANVLRADQDPEDYFTRIEPGASIFRIVEKRYEQTSLQGRISR